MSFNYNEIAAYYDHNYFNVAGIKSGYDDMVNAIGGDWHDRACQWFNNTIPVNGKKLLDAGCGLGHFMVGFERLGADVFGCDVSFYCEQVVNSMYQDKFWRTRLEDMDGVPDGTFDIVFCESTMEHIQESSVRAAFENLIRVTKKGGLVYLQVDTVPDSKRDMPEESHINIRQWGSWLGMMMSLDLHWDIRYDLTKMLCEEGKVPGFPLKDWKLTVLQTW